MPRENPLTPLYKRGENYLRTSSKVIVTTAMREGYLRRITGGGPLCSSSTPMPIWMRSQDIDGALCRAKEAGIRAVIGLGLDFASNKRIMELIRPLSWLRISGPGSPSVAAGDR